MQKRKKYDAKTPEQRKIIYKKAAELYISGTSCLDILNTIDGANKHTLSKLKKEFGHLRLDKTPGRHGKSESDKDEIISDIKKGMYVSALMRKYKIGYSYLSKIAVENGIEIKKKTYEKSIKTNRYVRKKHVPYEPKSTDESRYLISICPINWTKELRGRTE